MVVVDFFRLFGGPPLDWSSASLKALYSKRLQVDETRGLDRVAPSQLADRIDEEVAIIERKVLAGDYRLAPYVQVLRSKGAHKPPRQISIPSARDRIALLMLKERLHAEFPDAIGTTLPNSMVREALSALSDSDSDKHVCLRLDLKDFYGSIEHDRLLTLVQPRLSESETRLVQRAIRNPTVPRGSRREHVPRVPLHSGVPQGLAVSNILAGIYLESFDQDVAEQCDAYFRFVDDILLIVDVSRVQEVYQFIVDRLSDKGLEVHPLEPRTAKGGEFRIDERIEFLGYVFDGDLVTVRSSSVDAFLEKMAARMARFRRDRKRLVGTQEWMTPELVERVLLDELNERISGAVSESRRYGWIFYFGAMNDERLLFEMDAAVRSMFPRLTGIKTPKGVGLKRLARAIHEVRHRPTGAYIHNYDRYETMAQRLAFLVERGRLGPDQYVTEDQVNDLFERYRRQQLSELEADVAFLS